MNHQVFAISDVVVLVFDWPGIPAGTVGTVTGFAPVDGDGPQRVFIHVGGQGIVPVPVTFLRVVDETTLTNAPDDGDFLDTVWGAAANWGMLS